MRQTARAETTASSYAVIGAGPSGPAGARNLQRYGIPWTGYELGDDVGGLWNASGR
jgi:cation diffusion facilitator CzcD-associated flavoprotein CzcO